jgi:hypothetical protein
VNQAAANSSTRRADLGHGNSQFFTGWASGKCALAATLILLCGGLLGCASLPKMTAPEQSRNLSLGLHHAALYQDGTRCVGEFQAKSGEIVRVRLRPEFCRVVNAAVVATPRPPVTQPATPAKPPTTPEP